MESLSSCLRIGVQIFGFLDALALVVVAISLKIQRLLTLWCTLFLLIRGLYITAKRLIKTFLFIIGSKEKSYLVIKGPYSDFIVNFFVIYSIHILNKCEYGIQICSMYVRCLALETGAPKRLAEIFFVKQTILWDRPYWDLSNIFNQSYIDFCMRKGCNLFFCKLGARFLVGGDRGSIRGNRAFSTSFELDFNLNRLIIGELRRGNWPMENSTINAAVLAFIQLGQQRILTFDPKQQLECITPLVFDIRNRLYSIDSITKLGCNSEQAGYCGFLLKAERLNLLADSRRSKVFKQESSASNKSLRVMRLIDSVLQSMFLTFLDVVLEGHLKPNVFACRKGRDPRTAVAYVYSKIRSIRCKDINVFRTHIKCLGKVFYDNVLKKFPFPSKFQFLLKRWLRMVLIARDFSEVSHNVGTTFWRLMLEPRILNFMVSLILPLNIKKKLVTDSGIKRLWANVVFYGRTIFGISNDSSLLQRLIICLRDNLKAAGLCFKLEKTRFSWNTKDIVRFNFLSFEFLVIPPKRVKSVPRTLGRKPCQILVDAEGTLRVLLRPLLSAFTAIKKQILKKVSFIHCAAVGSLYRVFTTINSLVLGWAAYFGFNQGFNYVKKLDNFVFCRLRKALIKKFRYNGLVRPRWVAYAFFGLGRLNPNGKVCQIRSKGQFPFFKKVLKCVYIWLGRDTLTKKCIVSFWMSPQLLKKNYYQCAFAFTSTLSACIAVRLNHTDRFQLYKKQKGLCFLCLRLLDEVLLLSRNAAVDVFHILSCFGCLPYKVLAHRCCFLAWQVSKRGLIVERLS